MKMFGMPVRSDTKASDRPSGAHIGLRFCPAWFGTTVTRPDSTSYNETCQRLMDRGRTIHRPPRDGRMAFVKSPDGQSIELLQRGEALAPAEPWLSMPNTGEW